MIQGWWDVSKPTDQSETSTRSIPSLSSSLSGSECVVGFPVWFNTRVLTNLDSDTRHKRFLDTEFIVEEFPRRDWSVDIDCILGPCPQRSRPVLLTYVTLRQFWNFGGGLSPYWKTSGTCSGKE